MNCMGVRGEHGDCEGIHSVELARGQERTSRDVFIEQVAGIFPGHRCQRLAKSRPLRHLESFVGLGHLYLSTVPVQVLKVGVSTAVHLGR